MWTKHTEGHIYKPPNYRSKTNTEEGELMPSYGQCMKQVLRST
jgi:hypothetical protein